MTDPYCQINKIRLQKVASNKRAVSGGAYTLTNPGNLSAKLPHKTCDGDPEKVPKMVRGNLGGLGFHEFSKCES